WKRTSGPVRKNASLVAVIFCSQVPWNWGTRDGVMYPALFQCVGYPSYGINGPARHQGKGLPICCADGHVQVLSAAEIINQPQTTWPVALYTTIYWYSSTYLSLVAHP